MPSSNKVIQMFFRIIPATTFFCCITFVFWLCYYLATYYDNHYLQKEAKITRNACDRVNPFYIIGWIYFVFYLFNISRQVVSDTILNIMRSRGNMTKTLSYVVNIVNVCFAFSLCYYFATYFYDNYYLKNESNNMFCNACGHINPFRITILIWYLHFMFVMSFVIIDLCLFFVFFNSKKQKK